MVAVLFDEFIIILSDHEFIIIDLTLSIMAEGHGVVAVT